MKKYKLAYGSIFIMLLSACNKISTVSEVQTSSSSIIVEKEAAILNENHHEKYEVTMESNPFLVNAEMQSNGEAKTIFTYAYDAPIKVSLTNVGNTNFLYKIQNVEKESTVTNGVLNSNESFEQVFEGLPKGDYIISFVIQEEGSTQGIDLTVKVELLTK